MRLNLGCGFAHIDGYVNVDSWAGCSPDVICDLENETWPFEDDCAQFVFFDHSLEHMGASTAQFFHVMKELYRVCKDGAEIVINVPHPRSDLYLNDPTHVRPIHPETLGMFDQTINRRQISEGMKNSKLGMQTNTDFHIEQVTYIPDGRMHNYDGSLDDALRSQNNVASEIHIRMKAVKCAY